MISKKCITILKPSGKEKAWDNRGIYRAHFLLKKETITYIIAELVIQKDQTVLRVLD